MVVACCRSFYQITEVTGNTGQTKHTGFFVADIDDLCSCQIFFFCDKTNDRRIHIAASGSHHQAFQGRQTHGGIHGFTVVNCGYGSTVAKMAYDNFQILSVFSKQFSDTFGNEIMAGSMEAVTTYFVFFIIFIRQTV